MQQHPIYRVTSVEPLGGYRLRVNSSGSRLPERIPWDVTVENQRIGV